MDENKLTENITRHFLVKMWIFLYQQQKKNGGRELGKKGFG